MLHRRHNIEEGSRRLSDDQGCSAHQVVAKCLLILHVLQTVLADPQFGLLPIVLRKRREVPGIDLEVSYLDLVHILYFGDLNENH